MRPTLIHSGLLAPGLLRPRVADARAVCTCNRRTGMSFRKIAGAIAVAGALVAAGAVPSQAATVDDVKVAGTLRCGINTGLPGFAFTDDAGNWTGFDVAYCRTMAAAVLGDANAISFVQSDRQDPLPVACVRRDRRAVAHTPGPTRATSTSASGIASFGGTAVDTMSAERLDGQVRESRAELCLSGRVMPRLYSARGTCIRQFGTT